LQRAGVPIEYRTARTKPEIALAEIDRIMSVGVRFRCVLANAGYGLSAPFRQGLILRLASLPGRLVSVVSLMVVSLRGSEAARERTPK
jgi:hypothetical protein